MLNDERQQITTRVSELATLTPGRTGNLSIRRDERMAITPSGIPYEDITPSDVPVVSLSGDQLFGDCLPSSETPMHRHIYECLETRSIVHVHSPWATTLAILRQPLPPVHYMIALVGKAVPVADYATYGTEELAENVVNAMVTTGSNACLLSNHGLVAAGDDAENAIKTAFAVESVARVYCQACAIGEPVKLDNDEIEEVACKLNSYGPVEN